MKSRLGFTLIELLVVIGIIAVLSAILFPVFASAREKARQIVCLANNKQIALAITLYEQDYDEKTPNGVNPYGGGQGWAGQIYNYVKATNSYMCPDDFVTPTHNGSVPFHISSYAYNSQVSIACAGSWNGWNSNCSPDSLTLSAYTAPASTVLLAEVQNSTGYDITRGSAASDANNAVGDDYVPWNGGSGAGYGMGGSYDPSGMNSNNGTAGGQSWTMKWATGPLVNSHTGAAQNDFTPVGRHNGGSTFIMADGHAKYFRPSQVSGGALNTVDGSCGSPGLAAATDCATVAATFNIK